MNIGSIVNQTSQQIEQSANVAEQTIGNVNYNDPASMLKAQYSLQQYSVAIGYESAVMKSFKDMMMSIIAKIS